MSLLFDVVIVLLLILFAWRGAVRGLILSLCGLAAVFVAFFAAMFLSDVLCAPVADVIRPVIVQNFEGVVSDVMSGAVSDAVPDTVKNAVMDAVTDTMSDEIPDGMEDEILDAVSDAVAGVMSGTISGDMTDAILDAISDVLPGEMTDEMSDAIRDAISDAGGLDAGGAGSGYTVSDMFDYLKDNELFQRFSDLLKLGMNEDDLEQKLMSPVNMLADFLSRGIARLVVFGVVFIGVQLIWFLVSHMLDLAFHLPILSQVNLAGGLVFGLVKGVLLIIVLVWLGQVSGVVPNQPDSPILTLFTVKALSELLTKLPA